MLSDSTVIIKVEGKNLTQLDNEAGGHRIQRVPPTERKGRVHTSSVTVAVINPEIKVNSQYSGIGDKDFKVEWFSGTGKGGQHRNKHQNSCKLTHVQSGLTETRQGRKRQTNLRDAKSSLINKLHNMRKGDKLRDIAVTRKDQVGSGMRGDKIRTYRFQDNSVADHNTNHRARCTKVMKGYIDLLW